jgi:hypothetical protein
MSRPNELQGFGICEIQAVAQIDHSSDDSRFLNFSALPLVLAFSPP